MVRPGYMNAEAVKHVLGVSDRLWADLLEHKWLPQPTGEGIRVSDLRAAYARHPVLHHVGLPVSQLEARKLGLPWDPDRGGGVMQAGREYRTVGLLLEQMWEPEREPMDPCGVGSQDSLF